NDKPPPLASVPGVPGWLAELVSQLLEKNPSERPQSAAEVLERLDGARSGLKTPIFALKPGRRIALWAGAIFALGAVALYFYTHRATSLTSRQVKSLAVLPFVNASENPDTEYLSDGIAETLIDNLSQIPELHVIARTTAFRYKGKDVDLPK